MFYKQYEKENVFFLYKKQISHLDFLIFLNETIILIIRDEKNIKIQTKNC